MQTYKRVLILLLLLFAVAALVTVGILFRLNSNRLVLPKIGDEVRIIIRYCRANAISHQFDQRAFLLLRCVWVKNDSATFEVYYLKGDQRGKARYRFTVNYNARNAFRTCKVVDKHGRVVNRDGNVDGVPVPFTDVFGAYRYSLPACQKFKRGGFMFLTYFTVGRGQRMRLTYATARVPGTPGSYTENQYWSRQDSWMWGTASRYHDGPSENSDYHAARSFASR